DGASRDQRANGGVEGVAVVPGHALVGPQHGGWRRVAHLRGRRARGDETGDEPEPRAGQETGHDDSYTFLSSPSAHLTASSGLMPCPPLANMSVMTYLE